MAGSDIVIKCGICLTYFNEPKILPCFHTFCLKCLESYFQTTDHSGQFPCPVCRTPIVIPDGGVRRFQTNFYIPTRCSSDSEFDCDVCGNNESARLKCIQCDQNFCGNCAGVHVRMPSSREHNLVSVSHGEEEQHMPHDAITYCVKHPSEEITVICKDCNDLVCQVCRTTVHKDHSCNTISAEAADRRAQLRDLIDISDNNLKEIGKDMRVVKRQAESKYTYFNEQVTYLRQKRDLLISSINEKFSSFEEKIKQVNNEQRMLSSGMTENLKLTIESFEQNIDNSKEMAEAGNDVNLLRNFNSLVQKLGEIEVPVPTAVPGQKLMETVEKCTTWLIKLNEKTGDE
ncbi:E3 ubiquitin-protein ligase TRIM56-like [Mercenaria mercenaria]|uniref:E3 ubiquitin-protein ligase TRIM56-like n=1 Tax=Mercenaria mercenaria TaxID=6596 RepID=UPI00234E7FB5|nr:E3 ubiquitin-protein ligase TRIM56-like [Mercenaria mercenaria]